MTSQLSIAIAILSLKPKSPEATKLELNVLERRKYSMSLAIELLVLNIKDQLKRILPIAWYLKIRSQHQQTRAARRKDGNATILHNSQPERYEHWLNTVVQRELLNPDSDRVVFINAWNEWAEGNHLEPCQKWGHAYLEATHRVLNMAQSQLDRVVV